MGKGGWGWAEWAGLAYVGSCAIRADANEIGDRVGGGDGS